MVTTELVSIGLLAYVLTGVSIAGYDFSAPPLHKKFYVTQQNYGVATMIWFIWPWAIFRDAQARRSFPRKMMRLIIGVLVLYIGTFLWLRLFYGLALWVIGWEPVAMILAVATMIFGSPIVTWLAMPAHE